MSAHERTPRVQPTEHVHVVAAVIERNGRYLLARRPEQKRHGGLWEFPGGKVDDGESMFGAARRELDEELELRVTSVGARLLAVMDPGSPFLIDFRAVQVEGEPTAVEHDELGWFLPTEMRALRLAPADTRMARALMEIVSPG